MTRPASDEPCPCGNPASFANCCGPLIDGESAQTPERLMRSRYTAFAVGDATYLFETWHPGTRPEVVETDADTQWLSLRILTVERGAAGDRRGFVEFEARYRDSDGDGVLHERSRFVRQSERWWYLDGVLT